VLIGDVHEQPMLHLKIKPFNITARDWSGDVRCSVSWLEFCADGTCYSYMRQQRWRHTSATGT
jgi:hypothetical protein